MSKSRQYELVYILEPESTDEVVADLATQVQDIVSRFEGEIENTENWGRRKLAYEIGRHKEGVYVLHLINGAGDMVKEIDRRLRVIDTVIRHLVVRVDEALRVATRTTDRRLSRSRRRRVARGLSPDPQPPVTPESVAAAPSAPAATEAPAAAAGEAPAAAAATEAPAEADSKAAAPTATENPASEPAAPAADANVEKQEE